MKRLLAVLAAVLALAGTAQAAAESIPSFKADIVVGRDGSVSIIETVEYDFGDLAVDRHGIFRDIPINYRSDAGEDFYPQYEVIGVTNGRGTPVPYEASETGDYLQLKIGDPDVTVQGIQTYQISYRLFPLVLKGGVDDAAMAEPRGGLPPGGDVLALDINGTGWEVPFGSVEATVKFEDNLEILAFDCFTGVQGSAAQSCSKTETAGVLTFQAQNLVAGENLTIAARVPEGSFTSYLEAGQRRPIKWERYIGLLLGGLVLLWSVCWLVATFLRDYLIKRDRTIIAEYEPPKGLTPAEIGHLIDDRSDMVELTATFIDLATRGYLKIEQTQPKRWWRKAEYRFTKLKPLDDLADYEVALLAALFGANQTVTTSEIDRAEMSRAATKFHDAVAKQLKAKGYYSSVPKRWGRQAFAVVFIGLRIAAIFLAPVFALFSGYFVGPSLVMVALAILVMWFARRRARLTPQGFEQWADIKGFQRFLSVTEKDRLAFHDAPEKTPGQFSHFLPFAIALGVEQQWAAQFAGIDVAAAVGGWYYPYGGGHFSAGDVSSNLKSNFGAAVASSFTAPSNSSGGGFSGGSSGGGFGGGGGGSW